MQVLKEIIIKEAFADAALKGKISDRMYPSELALIEKPSFPCVNFKIDAGQEWDYTLEMQDINLSFWCFSTDSLDEAYSIHADLKRIFLFQTSTNTEISAQLREVVPPQ